VFAALHSRIEPGAIYRGNVHGPISPYPFFSVI